MKSKHSHRPVCVCRQTIGGRSVQGSDREMPNVSLHPLLLLRDEKERLPFATVHVATPTGTYLAVMVVVMTARGRQSLHLPSKTSDNTGSF